MSDLKFTEDHEWLRTEADGTVAVGITDFAQQQLGDLVYVQLPEVGTTLAAGDAAAVVESVKSAGDIRIPVAATVVEVNGALAESPGLVNEDPLGAGWFFKVKLDDPSALSDLMNEAAYGKFVAELI